MPILSPLLSAMVSIITGAVTIAFIAIGLNRLANGQQQLTSTMAEMSRWIGTLAGAATTNHEQHQELSKRIAAAELTQGLQAESIRILRARSHQLANQLQILDPTMKPYAE